MVKIYHNPRCKKSRAGHKYLEDKSIDFETVKYLKDAPFTEESLSALLKKLGKAPREIVRTQEAYFKTELKGKEFSDTDWVKIMVQNPKLIQRPIVETQDKAVIADPPDKADEVL